jgi:hypothetical protein
MKKASWFSFLALAAAGLVLGGTITVTHPSGGSVAMGSHCPIAWTASGVSVNVKIVLVKSGGTAAGVLANNLAPGSSPYDWTVAAPAEAGQQYQVRVRAVDGSVMGMSPVFTVIAAAGNAIPASKADLQIKRKGPSEKLKNMILSMKPPDLVPSCTANIGKVNTVSTFTLGLKNMGEIAYNRQTCEKIKFYYCGTDPTSTPVNIVAVQSAWPPYPILGGGTFTKVVSWTFTQKGKYTYEVIVNPPECREQTGPDPEADLTNNSLSEKVFWIE